LDSGSLASSAWKANPYDGRKRIEISNQNGSILRRLEATESSITGYPWIVDVRARNEAERKSVESNPRAIRVRRIGGCATQDGCPPQNSADKPETSCQRCSQHWPFHQLFSFFSSVCIATTAKPALPLLVFLKPNMHDYV
jgi:hypothetical protein